MLHIFVAKESDVIRGVLGLVDLTFTANLIVIVIFSGCENFVSGSMRASATGRTG